MHLYRATMNLIQENIYRKCRVCVKDIEDLSQAITIFCKDFLDEKIRKYLHVTIDFSDKYQKRICRDCLIKLEDIHQFACLAQKNQQIFIKYAESFKAVSPAKITKTPLLSNEDVTIFAYDDLKLGQIIKDQGLLKLILKALKWDDSNKTVEEQLDILKNTNFQDVLCNSELLRDEDLMQLLGPYVNQDAFLSINKGPSSIETSESQEEQVITEMEVGVDPELFFPYDDDETRSAEEVISLEDIKPLTCTTCPDVFNTENELQEHILKHMIDKHNVAEEFESQQPLKRTRRKPTSSRFMCSYCGKKLSTKGNLKVHVETHKPKGKFSCEKCGRIFKTYLNLVRHKKYHSGEKFACPSCGRVYPTNSTLRAHIITHSNIRPHECPICCKTFKRNQDLKFHINQHTGDKPYKCLFCPKAFASSGNCFSHRKRMHSDKL